MNSQNEDLFDDADAADEMDQHGLALHQIIQDYLDEHDLSDEAGAILLLSIGLRMRMVGYALETEHPSASGLKMDLDRFNREIGDAVRAAKKSAEEFIEEAKELREAAESAIDDDDDLTEEDFDAMAVKDRKGAPS